jgi:transmembrane sensor
MKLLSIWSRRPRTAAEWFTRLRQPPVTRDCSDSFMRWLASTPGNEVAYEAREIVWELSADLRGRPGFDALIKEAEAVAAERRAGVLRGSWIPMPLRVRPLTAAAAVLGIALVGFASFFWITRPVLGDYQTAIGEQRVVALPDGSTVTLNTGSHIHTRYTRTSRIVDLDVGEALFSVAKDPRRPFEVRTLNGVTTDIGTQFVVRRTGERAEVTVIEGVVRVNTATSVKVEDGVTLSAGQAMDYSAAGDRSPVRAGDLQRIEAWRAHRILFSDTPLSDAINEYNRYAAVPIVLQVDSLAPRRVHGVFRIGEEQAFIHALEQALPVRAVETPTQIAIVAK